MWVFFLESCLGFVFSFDKSAQALLADLLLCAQLVASACLLLAGKVEENFKSLQKITETSYFVKNKKDPKAMDAFKVNPVSRSVSCSHLR